MIHIVNKLASRSEYVTLMSREAEPVLINVWVITADFKLLRRRLCSVGSEKNIKYCRRVSVPGRFEKAIFPPKRYGFIQLGR
jgi:hypothetical protein